MFRQQVKRIFQLIRQLFLCGRSAKNEMKKLLFLLSFVLLTNAEAKTKSTKYEKHELKYFEEFLHFIENYDMEGKIVNFYFYGEKNETVRKENLRKLLPDWL